MSHNFLLSRLLRAKNWRKASPTALVDGQGPFEPCIVWERLASVLIICQRNIEAWARSASHYAGIKLFMEYRIQHHQNLHFPFFKKKKNIIGLWTWLQIVQAIPDGNIRKWDMGEKAMHWIFPVGWTEYLDQLFIFPTHNKGKIIGYSKRGSEAQHSVIELLLFKNNLLVVFPHMQTFF